MLADVQPDAWSDAEAVAVAEGPFDGRGSTRSPGRGGSCGGSGAVPTGRCSTGRPERGGCGSGSGTAPTGPHSAGCQGRCGNCGGGGRAPSARRARRKRRPCCAPMLAPDDLSDLRLRRVELTGDVVETPAGKVPLIDGPIAGLFGGTRSHTGEPLVFVHRGGPCCSSLSQSHLRGEVGCLGRGKFGFSIAHYRPPLTFAAGHPLCGGQRCSVANSSVASTMIEATRSACRARCWRPRSHRRGRGGRSWSGVIVHEGRSHARCRSGSTSREGLFRFGFGQRVGRLDLAATPDDATPHQGFDGSSWRMRSMAWLMRQSLRSVSARRSSMITVTRAMLLLPPRTGR